MESTAAMITVTINGKELTLDPSTTIAGFLASKGYHERLVVVEINEAIVPRSAYATTTFAPGDRVEIVHFVGGG